MDEAKKIQEEVEKYKDLMEVEIPKALKTNRDNIV